MFITWLGQSCFKIQSRDVQVITDPVSKKSGLKQPRFANIDIVTISNPEYNPGKLKTDALIIDGPGEYEAKQVYVKGIAIEHENGNSPITVYWIEMEGVSMGHLGSLNGALTDQQLESLEGLDVLFIPVGDNGVLDAKKASEVISQIEPRIVIPMHYKISGLTEKRDTIDNFKKAMGVNGIEKLEDRLTIKKKELPQDDMQVTILQPQ
ncbi:MBL fold metallo-hydrolase [Patescibacteria group bacterium]|nr:MBL fold metallo-hydrolase [Patescibacteria group bacterium]MBU1075513.1 MBL fold metallo-hydrolase [Patescibacteria group bacterium]MBU1952575.1 MBL fold metallo-hydrolase [Patescibacteria group bacterium]